MSFKALLFDEEQKREFLVWEHLEQLQTTYLPYVETLSYLETLYKCSYEEIEQRFENLLHQWNDWDEERTEEMLNEFLDVFGYKE